MNLKVLGTVGMLVWAKKAGKLQSLKEELNALRHHGRFRIGQAILERALREVDEL
jgi:predicted nucleic acid-binding protein